MKEKLMRAVDASGLIAILATGMMAMISLTMFSGGYHLVWLVALVLIYRVFFGGWPWPRQPRTAFLQTTPQLVGMTKADAVGLIAVLLGCLAGAMLLFYARSWLHFIPVASILLLGGYWPWSDQSIFRPRPQAQQSADSPNQ